MGIDEPNSTPKLTLSKLPCKQRLMQQIQINLTPPHRPLVSIPFQWEEAPGKPRRNAGVSKLPPSKATRYNLDLPPRLLNDEAKITKMPSPTTVLDGPYVGRSLSLACTLSFRKGPLRPTKKIKERSFGSGRWEGLEFDGRGSSDFSTTTLGDLFKSEKIAKKRSFFSLTGMSSNLWGDIYASFKHAIPCRRR